ncbi:thiamine pyrophosphate-binding protein [Jatrophihabitans cynanchi]|uniref:Thiamine pyrophosphate-binding protein n=1 Tax=Jatrophihabitans cynanchi TaxID=2944128 RepID=A0ABY7K471_9ACTN|nr:thiamine pyrophosphate-binding protein [Jatrophihabitans sp. SB3-54]WAX58985.1 thiamine pyrophosphate-binding protein [Jatrophihabitans sp. SB3-54]
MKFYEALSQLVAERVTVVFGLVGDGNLFFVDHYARSGGRYVPGLHEASAVMMAVGHARTTGEPAVATLTHGPGLTNGITALVEAVRTSTPLLLVVGDTATTSRYHTQDVDQQPLVAASGARFVQVRAAQTLAEDFAVAFAHARERAQPVVLNVPIDLMWTDVDAPELRPYPAPAGSMLLPDDAQLDKALGIVASAEHPLVLAGRGARAARDSLLSLADMLGAPVATTLRAKDLFYSEPADLGVFGSLAAPATQAVVAAADCIVAFGAALNPHTTDRGHLTNGKSIVQVDVDAAAFGRFQEVDAAVNGDVSRVAERMTAMLRELGHRPRHFNSGPAIEQVRAWPTLVDRGTAETVDIRVALDFLDRALPAQRSIVVDVGRFVRHAVTLLHVPDANSWFGSGAGFSAIGLGIGMAIGVAVARPDQPAVLVCGDGGFMLGGLNEFRTAVEQKLDLICVVCNDHAYGAEHVQLVRRGLDPNIASLTPPDLTGLARSLGGDGVTIRNTGQLNDLRDHMASRDRPLLIDLRCDPALVSTTD